MISEPFNVSELKPGESIKIVLVAMVLEYNFEILIRETTNGKGKVKGRVLRRGIVLEIVFIDENALEEIKATDLVPR